MLPNLRLPATHGLPHTSHFLEHIVATMLDPLHALSPLDVGDDEARQRSALA